MSDSPLSWTVVVPVKGTADGKSRMAPALDPELRAKLVEAFALDAVAALAASPHVGRVVVVTDAAAAVARSLRALGADIVPDPGRGLNAAVRAGIAAPREPADPSAEPPVAALLGDLPCLTTSDVDDALAQASVHPLAVVPDAAGTGTTLITALPGVRLEPRFGAGSAARHRAAGHVVLDIDERSTLRLDVDTETDLEAALARGVGANTARALR
ncbi:2-phospho-L-lactate guanylyltransferase [Herbiconiux daphne]|uniref:Phosphoenolpyruvate guanylyltransferase n=1 Tax=Herbiconiux daphne TaxID=2970914 RepID=A0ABT2H8C5_9MICO|nr:2-phospho-L-lactate guanylyltransferase [Herbiconiux daphne]MCS5736183.1 2-phospho-L-lactate guanylyltransferase [Herbiconiux daphne]